MKDWIVRNIWNGRIIVLRNMYLEEVNALVDRFNAESDLDVAFTWIIED